MSDPQDFNVDYLAHLARLALTPEEKTRFAAQLGDVLHHIERLSEVNVNAVEPTAHAFPVENVWDADVPRAGLSVADALRNAPAQRENMISVPKVIE
ncbi:MAG: Asp-tRNA(Asn)/Glu-tRNA(Gln) amidotransferase GatCAB subunit C [Opitutus sp.]|nr:Asp-tRNA(Asn)/Glu-tRNA(Gln) amidotransferase GatCAB subunit C [Opitutus sp.]